MIIKLGNLARCPVILAHVITHMSRWPDSSEAGLDLVFPTHFRPELTCHLDSHRGERTVGSPTLPCLFIAPHICVFFFPLSGTFSPRFTYLETSNCSLKAPPKLCDHSETSLYAINHRFIRTQDTIVEVSGEHRQNWVQPRGYCRNPQDEQTMLLPSRS